MKKLINIEDVYYPNNTVVPVSRKELIDILDFGSVSSYILCRANDLKKTFKRILSKPYVTTTRNPDVIYNTVNSADPAYNCIIQVEGMRKDQDVFLSNILTESGDKYYTSFSDYPKSTQCGFMALKLNVFKRILWNYENIENWFEDTNVQLPDAYRDELINDWDKFRDLVISSDIDLQNYILSCSENSKILYIEAVEDSVNQLIHVNTFRSEIAAHAKNLDVSVDTITLKNAVITKIYVAKECIYTCLKEFPNINFIDLNLNRLSNIMAYIPQQDKMDRLHNSLGG